MEVEVHQAQAHPGLKSWHTILVARRMGAEARDQLRERAGRGQDGRPDESD